MIWLNNILGALACLSLGIATWQWLAARRFPLHQRTAVPGFAPAVTLLKPLKGSDATTADSLRSWFRQDYAGPVQILFGIAEAGDSAGDLVRQLLAEYPDRDAQLIVCDRLAGANAKVAKLVQLEKLARHDLILVSDADVRVEPDFLANIVGPLREEKCVLVNCFYRLANPVNRAMQWEAIAINADFWSQVLQSISLQPLDFALGAVMLTRRPALAAIGGFPALANCLADDYQLGHRLAQTGRQIALCPVVVECWGAPMTWRQVWKHQLRWARTIRVCQPWPYFFSLLANASLWAGLWLVVSLLATRFPGAPWVALSFLFVRMLQAHQLQGRFTPDRRLIAPAWLVPVKDGLQAALWFSAFAGNTVEWRGRKMTLRSDGTLIEENGGR